MRQESWVESAQNRELGRPLAGLPYCVFSSGDEPARVGVGIGDQVLNLAACARLGLLHGLSREVSDACGAAVLNPLIACGTEGHAGLRRRVTELLGTEVERGTTEQALARLDAVELRRPVDVPNYTDFYASIEHAESVGRLFRPEQPLLPNYRHLPIGYHGRASSIVVSGTAVVRPCGQSRGVVEEMPRFGPSTQMDYEMEIGAYVCGGNRLGETISLADAAGQIFGLSLVNDWSARDIQAWEYQPLGPFLGKSFQTSVSPWVVPMAALMPFQVPARARTLSDPELLPYLQVLPGEAWTLDITVEAWLQTRAMREAGAEPVLLGRSNLAGLYWTIEQMIAHHTSNGCNLIAGDLLATGTISGARSGEQGCLLEMTRRGASPVRLPSGESRVFLEDGDEVVLKGFCEEEGRARICLGECRGTVVAGS